MDLTTCHKLVSYCCSLGKNICLPPNLDTNLLRDEIKSNMIGHFALDTITFFGCNLGKIKATSHQKDKLMKLVRQLQKECDIPINDNFKGLDMTSMLGLLPNLQSEESLFSQVWKYLPLIKNFGIHWLQNQMPDVDVSFFDKLIDDNDPQKLEMRFNQLKDIFYDHFNKYNFNQEDLHNPDKLIEFIISFIQSEGFRTILKEILKIKETL